MSQTETTDFLRKTYNKMMLNKKEAAKEIGGISEATLDRMVKDGELKSKRIRGQVFFRIDDIAEYLEEV